jgi:hypothetical protein
MKTGNVRLGVELHASADTGSRCSPGPLSVALARQEHTSPGMLAYNRFHADGLPERTLSAVLLLRGQRRTTARDSNRARFWLDPVRLAESGGFGRAEIRRVEALVRDNAVQLRRAWDEHFAE